MFAVTQDMLEEVNDAWSDFLSEDNEEEDDCELYLYMMADGHWVIDHAQYFTGWNSVRTMAPICHYTSVSELRTELEMNSSEWEWEAVR